MLHIVHPYTFKLKDRRLLRGSIEEYHERDCKLSRLVKTALAYNYPVFVHSPPGLGAIYEATVLKSDDLFAPLFNPRVTWVGTDDSGMPLQDAKPEGMPEVEWESILDITATHSQFVDLIGKPDEILVCGGEYSRCEINFMAYIAAVYRKFDRRFYIPELSVIIPEDRHLKDETTAELKKLGFKPVSYEEALGIVGNPPFSHSSQYNSQNQQQKSD